MLLCVHDPHCLFGACVAAADTVFVFAKAPGNIRGDTRVQGAITAFYEVDEIHVCNALPAPRRASFTGLRLLGGVGILFMVSDQRKITPPFGKLAY